MNARRNTLARIVEYFRHEMKYVWLPLLESDREDARKRKQMRRWLEQLAQSPPQVFLGANIDVNGGVRQHLLGIQEYSSLSVQLAPPDGLRGSLSYHDFHTVLRREFFDFQPVGVRAIHSHVYPYFIEWCAAKRSNSIRWVHTYHAPYLPEYGKNGLEPWQVEINQALIDVAANADVRISVSRWQQEYLRERHDIDTLYVPNGVDVKLCDSGSAARFRDWTGLDDFVLYVGRNDPVKNPADFVRLAASLPRLTFAMIGNGLNATGMLNDWGIESPSNLRFLGELSRPQVQDAIAASSAVVITSRREGMPTLVLEAMSHQKPVVIPADPGCLEAAGNSAFGFVFPHGNLQELAEQTRRALSERFDGAGARAHAVNYFDWRVIAPRLDAIYLGAGDSQ